MSENYAQNLVDELFEEGDRDFHFFNDFLGFFENTYQGLFRRNRIDLNKLRAAQLDDALLLASFFIASNAYVGFYMKEYGEFDKTFENSKEFEKFIRQSVADDSDYLDRISMEDRYTVGLKKIKVGEKAPLITPEIEKIFNGQ